MARIPDAFIDDLLARSDLVELIGSRVPLKRQGRDYSARCPFHDERSPSFTVSPTKQFYHCFGCGAHGTAISFLMNYDRLEFIDAVEELAKRVGMEVPRDTQARNEDSDGKEQYLALEAAARFFQKHPIFTSVSSTSGSSKLSPMPSRNQHMKLMYSVARQFSDLKPNQLAKPAVVLKVITIITKKQKAIPPTNSSEAKPETW